MAAKIIRSRQSISDLREIWSYIAKDSEFYADGWIRQLNEHIEYLAQHNGRCRPRPELFPNLRSSGLKEYVIFYNPLGDSGVEVIRILHSSRDINPTLFN